MVDVRSALSGSRILITGSTGFLGTALVSKILTSVPDIGEIILLVRSKPAAPASDRVRRRILGNNAFAHLKGLDNWDELTAKITTIDGDLRTDGLGLSAEDTAKLASADFVVHSAASVSFDSPVDEAFDTNLLGSLRMIDAVRNSGANPRRYVHVSTAYVAGLAKGRVPEAPWSQTPGRPRVDWHAELEVSKTTRATVEAQSRSIANLNSFARKARRDIGPAGAPSVGSRAEQLRRDWVNEQMVELGRVRAQSLGWPDAYTFTKALTEVAVEERQVPFPLTILRPSIIESALAEPSPGWIRGFRMAEPIFLMFGRGALTEFPGIPDAVVDVVPVDIVVNAILAACATPDAPAYVHASTGARNPMRYRQLVKWSHEYFHANPYLDEDGAPILPSMWKFPGRRSVEFRLKWARRGLDAAARVVERLPGTALQDASDRLDMQRDELEQANKYALLYGAYAEVEAIFDDKVARGLHDSLTDPDAFGFDVTKIDWKIYLQDNHLPEITRRRSAIRRRPRPPAESEIKQGGENVLAVFDLEGTVLGTNVVDTYLWLRLAASPRHEWAKRIGMLARDIPGLLAVEKRDRGDFLRRFYRRYEGAPVEDISALAFQSFNDLILPRCFPAGIRRIREHRAAGHHIVFITGALDFTIAPMAPLADHIAAATLEQHNGVFSGDLSDIPLAGDARAAYLRQLADELGADLRASYAYADSISDLPMLESVGNPVVVSPDHRLARIARDRRWPVERWGTESNAPRFSMPGASR